MVQDLKKLAETPSQTAGPYVHIGAIPSFAGLSGIYPGDLGDTPIRDGAKGEIVTISGFVLDGLGHALGDAMIECWQADANGLFPGQVGADPEVSGFCRVATDKDSGLFRLRTIKPGATRLRDGRAQAPHIALWIVARGINIGLQTRIYFDDEDNSADPVLNRQEHSDRISTLIAHRENAGAYRFDIRLQGKDETVFLDM